MVEKRPRFSRSILALGFVLLWMAPALRLTAAEEPVDLEMLTRIRDEGFHHSQVMKTVRHLTDDIGPRLTGSPQAKQANDWTRQQLADWGLANAHLEPYEFGRGWSFSAASAALVKPQQIPLSVVPKPYTPATNGPVQGALMRVKIESEKDFDQYRGKLAGKILLLDEAHDFTKDKVSARRYTGETLEDLGRYQVPREGGDDREKRGMERFKLRRAKNTFFTTEKVAATLEASGAPWGILRVSGGGAYKPGEDAGPPALVVSAEQYDRILHLLDGRSDAKPEAKSDAKPEEKTDTKAEAKSETKSETRPDLIAEVDVRSRYYDDDPNAYNTIAEIPGTDRKGEVVMVGAHLDSWHAGTGATDNAAGSAIAMEAVRILKALGVKPRRTIRIGLWTGEEQGLIGSLAYVTQHFGGRPEPTDPEQKALPAFLRKPTGPVQVKPEHAKLSAYFNVDNGGGKIRGIYAEENAAEVPIFEAWLRPLRDLGADNVTMRHTGATDHVAFDGVGLPGFQFIQDELDYSAMTHHTNMDTYDHLEREDMMQASVVMASFLYQAAMRPERMPRKPMPKE